MDSWGRPGTIAMIVGGMFAGKTEELLRRLKRLFYAKKAFLLFKPSIDHRYYKDKVTSHNQNTLEAIVINKPEEIYKYLKPDTYAVGIDEIQFFDRSIIKVVEDLANKNILVIGAGLDLDFKAEPFGVMPELLARAESVSKLTAICQVCGNPAGRTQRLINGKPAKKTDPTILIGALDSYEARCRHCHILGEDD